MTRLVSLAFALPLALAATGCTEEAAPPAEQGGKAAGEVLGGSISDAMIPLEQLESQAPLAPRQGPAATDIDADQPEVTPAEGIEGGPASEGAEPAIAAPAPEPSE
jgi:hypothetical protein